MNPDFLLSPFSFLLSVLTAIRQTPAADRVPQSVPDSGRIAVGGKRQAVGGWR